MDARTEGRIGHLAGIAALTLALLWPAFWSGGPTAFFDSSGYYERGGAAVGVFLERTGLAPAFSGDAPATGDASIGAPAAGDASAGGAEGDGDADPVKDVRSVPYSVFVNLAVRVAGPLAAVFPAALVTAWLIWLMMAPLRPSRRLAAGGVLAVATTLPFYAAQIMPDIYAAWLIAIPLIAMRRDGAVGWLLGGALLLAATAAILFHYSHIPLAATTGAVLGLWLLGRRRYGSALLAQLPLVLAVAVNLALSVAMSGGGGGPAAPAGARASAAEEAPRLSIAPARLPVLLARLLEDGVAVRYLSETCPGNGFAICEVYERLPASSRATLWGENSLRRLATPGQMRRISGEEIALAREVILYDPWAQALATAGNTVEQLVRFGLGGMRLAEYEIGGAKEIHIELRRVPSALFRTLETIQAATVALATLALLALVWRVPAARAPVALLAVALLANAFVCGALSAPAGRYQGRMIWLVVATALAFAPLWPRRAGRGTVREDNPAAPDLHHPVADPPRM